jgi:hypothetical protein
MLRTRDTLIGLALLALSVPLGGRAQERIVLSKEISVGRSEAALGLEFADGGKLALALRDGAVLVDGASVGSFAPGDPLDVAWRALLADVVTLEDGPLARTLRAWEPPSTLDGDRLSLARRIDEALEAALAAPASPAPPSSPALSLGRPGNEAITRILLGQTARLATLGEALKGLGPEIRMHIDEDVEVAGGETVQGSLVVIQGDARIAGTVEGDVVVVDGTLDLLDGSVVRGDVRLVDAELDREGGLVEGEVRHVEAAAGDREQEIRARLREELRAEVRRELRREGVGGGRGLFSPLRRVADGVGGILGSLVAVFILGLVGLGMVSFAPQNLDTVAEAARRAPGRAAMVGLAGAFLLIPVWVLGFVALLVTIVGIPVAIAWIPLFPLAAVAGALLGYVAVARNVGEWLADSGYPYTDWIRKSSSMTTIVGGLVGLAAFFIAAHVLGIVPFFGFLKGLLMSVGVMAAVAASLVGFGAVLLTRAGRRPEHHPGDLDEAWERIVDDEVDVDAAAGGSAAPAEGTGGGGDA